MKPMMRARYLGSRRSAGRFFPFRLRHSQLDWRMAQRDTANKPKIQGERISIVAAQGELAIDPQTAAAKMDLPPPHKNADWPLPGGTADNIPGNLTTDGPLEQVWSVSAGKGSDDDSRLTAPPIVAGGLVYVLDAESACFRL